jgi:Trp operon repressor
MLHSLPWEVPASIAAAAALAVTVTRMVKALRVLTVSRHRHPDDGSQSRDRWKRLLRTVIVTLHLLLTPVFFWSMFNTVTDLVRSSFVDGAPWTVPVATEGCFMLLFLWGLYLLLMGKPSKWLPYTPYPFAAGSLFLNIYAAHGNIPGIVGHGMITLAFFVPIFAAENAITSLAASDEQVKLAAALGDVRRYALDVVRDERGAFWRRNVPSLLRRQVLRSRPPAIVSAAVKAVLAGEAETWEPAVERWVIDGLTRKARVSEDVKDVTKAIARRSDQSALPSRGPSPDSQDDRQVTVTRTVTSSVTESVTGRTRALQILMAEPDLTEAEVAEKAGVSASTVTRAKRALRAGDVPEMLTAERL